MNIKKNPFLSANTDAMGNKEYTLVANSSNYHYIIALKLGVKTKLQKPTVYLCWCEKIPQISALNFFILF